MILVNNGEGKKMTRAEIQELIGDLGGITLTTNTERSVYGRMASTTIIAYIKFPATDEATKEIDILQERLNSKGLETDITVYNAVIAEIGTI